MQEYMINVALGMLAPTFACLLVVVFGFFFRKKMQKLNEKTYRWFVEGALIAWVLSLIIEASSTSITYKHEPFDKLQEQHKVEMINKQEHESPRKIQDLSKPIKPNVENFDELVDYKE